MFLPPQSFLSRKAKQLKSNPTKAELVMKSILESIGIRFTFQSKRWHKNELRIFDFYIPKPYYFAIEVDGEYHDPERDKFRDDTFKLKRPRFSIIRFTNSEVINNSEETKQILLKGFGLAGGQSVG